MKFRFKAVGFAPRRWCFSQGRVWLVALALFCSLGAQAAVRHEARVALDPLVGRLTAEDTITFDRTFDEGGVRLLLHRGMAPVVLSPGWTLAAQPPAPGDPPHGEAFLASRTAGGEELKLAYGGVISHLPRPVGNEYARGFSASPGIISTKGVVLSGESLWLPEVEGAEVVFDVTVSLPQGWDCVSQGDLVSREEGGQATVVRYRSNNPGEGVHLIAARFTRYERTNNGLKVLAYLREPDPALAAKFLDATVQYVEMYAKFLGPYPFSKFALVENFWETGYGMPSFTLLGSKVVRFPFIMRSSYPHEILHNWWGNGVYVDYASGNWCEGLTAYLADHLLAEQAGGGAEYRESTLQKYADYVAKMSDGPLTGFTSRHSAATEALGYGKALMVFHMLRGELGDALFIEGLRKFYKDHLFKRASWSDLERSFNEGSGRDLSWFFSQWVRRTGAPSLRLEGVRVSQGERGFTISGEVAQLQPGEPYRLKVQVAATVAGGGEPLVKTVELSGTRAAFEIETAARPLRVDLDPWYDLFRLLSREEIPPALSGAFGEESVTVVLPTGGDGGAREGYAKLAEAWRGSGEGEYRVVSDDDPAGFPAKGSVWVLGSQNRYLDRAHKALEGYPLNLSGEEFSFGKTTLPRANHSIVATGRLPDGVQVTLLVADPVKAVPGLARKLPHYHKYSYLAFEGDEPVNVVKGRWEARGAAVSVRLEGGDAPLGREAKITPLAELPTVFSRERMLSTVGYLASPQMAGRGLGSEGLTLAADYLAREFAAAGLKPGGTGGSYFREFAAKGEGGREFTLRNVVGFIEGSKKEWEGQAVVVGAHYDHLGLGWPDVREANRGQIHPGADDNASGVAVLLELARRFAGSPPERSIVFVAFSGEEAGRAGSIAFLKEPSPWPASSMMGMVNLDTVGRLGKGRILVLGAGSASEWIHIFNGAAFVTGAKVEPAMKDIGSGDQTSFLDAGVPAVQLFTGAHSDYHSVGDTPDKIDAAGLATVAAVAFEAVQYMGGRAEPLTSTLAGRTPSAQAAGAGGGRKVSLGTVPDFTWAGEGVRVSEVGEGTPAMKAGIEPGDVIVAVDGEKVSDLKAFSAALKKLSPSQTVSVEFIRGDSSRKVEISVVSR